MANITIFGRLGRPVQLNKTQSGKSVLHNAIAEGVGKNANGEKITVWYEITAFDKTAELIKNFFEKGDGLLFEGHFTNEKKKISDKEITTLNLVVDKIIFDGCIRKKTDNTNQSSNTTDIDLESEFDSALTF